MIGPVFGGWNSPAGDTFKCFRDKPRWGQLRIDTDGNGLLLVKSKAGTDLISAGADVKGHGFFFEGFNKTGEGVVQLSVDDYGNGVVGAYNREGKGRTLKSR